MNLKLLLILLLALCGSSVSICLKSSTIQYAYKDKWYYFETFYKATWFKAFMACNRMDMELLSIDSNEEFDKIHEFVKNKTEYKNNQDLWTSGTMKDAGQFNWMYTGNPVSVSRWHTGQPNNYGGKQFCLHMWLDKNQFRLNDMECFKENVAAKMNLKLLVISLVAFCSFSAPTYVNDKLYYFETYFKASWFKAYMTCSKMGMELLSIDSVEEFDKFHTLVKDIVEYKNNLDLWTSGAMKDAGQFYWINTVNPVLSSKWHPGEPNNKGGMEFCLHVFLDNKQFLLNDLECSIEKYFVCESRKI
ncbi:PREDICTED: macrophage mannose receptor 1-like [Nicrophorus vespilloides]|uniref:Macrophage mannose receptor 1-like n=1 Tax=Nicrophorus vespilloides TaxID=110193 RepID=A0ABM1M9E3_NICVS|nr:PREDICTED: macrophage mannose receptor 1-like [Nicrophorus vespilloides]